MFEEYEIEEVLDDEDLYLVSFNGSESTYKSNVSDSCCC